MTRDSRLRPTLPLKHRFQFQQGNTLTGIVIGLIVGLVIAVAVALAITKGATPFTDKTGKAGKMSEPTAGQAADPNKPLYGNKDAARAANKQVTEKPKPATPAEADPLGAAIANMKEKAAPAPAPAPAPTQVATAPAQNVIPSSAAEPAEEKITYYLQAGAFREVADAENTRAKLALLGFEAVISERANDSGVLHRVRIGPFGQVESMNKARAKLVDAGIDVAIVRNQK
ncbi:SPOR domain-containing protein [Massilia atriviolacea]|uniref:SPOR domain-containing protein n=1 Tax=Massilia atriviolacea TaxID=2495579 RepID=A0A430HLS9_9BURK|nr:SPOR domain-containing protein [Massilia atriviolacea]RSZ58434.1 SPOR domain-containing protein [Massilia atriviolacea]